MDEAEPGIEEVVIEDALLSGPALELWALRAGDEREGAAGFQGAEDGDESFADALVPDELLRPLVLVERAGAVLVAASGLLRPLLRVQDQTVGVLRREGLHEVAAAHLEHGVDEVLKLLGCREREMAFEEDSVEAVQRADDQVGELHEKATY